MIALLLAVLAIVPRVREGDVQSFTSLTDAQGRRSPRGNICSVWKAMYFTSRHVMTFPTAA
jgi:hypothetical protein